MIALVGAVCAPVAAPAAIFVETFDSYTFPPGENRNPGLPEISEGADAFWYAGRFGNFTGTSLASDIEVLQSGGGSNETPAARVEDDAGLIFHIPAASADLTLTYDWRTSGVETSDFLVGGYFTGNLGLDQGANREHDFFADFGGDQAAFDAWWSANWVEFLRARSSSWQSASVALPGDTDLWVVFWLDNGEGDRGLFDNVRVAGGVEGSLPEPVASVLLALGIGALAVARRVHGA